MLSKYKHISFDLDGTLVHTAPEYRYKIVSATVERLGGEIKDKGDVDRFWFESSRDEIIKTGFGIEPEKFWKLFEELHLPEERFLHTQAYGDSENALKRLKETGKVVSIITGAPHHVAEMEIKRLNGAPYDLHFSIYESEFKDKPDPGSFKHVLEKLSFEPVETVYIGNSDEDALYAKNCGVDFIYLERKEHPFNLKDYALATVHSLEELF